MDSFWQFGVRWKTSEALFMSKYQKQPNEHFRVGTFDREFFDGGIGSVRSRSNLPDSAESCFW